MTKENRLSFRISDDLSDLIDLAVEKFDIRDTSEFGTQAIQHYLMHLVTATSEKKLIADAIAALSLTVDPEDTSTLEYFYNYTTGELPPFEFDRGLVELKLSPEKFDVTN